MQAGETNASAFVKMDSKSDASAQKALPGASASQHASRITTLDGRTYEQVTVIGNTGDSILIKYRGEGGGAGMAQIKYKNLPADLYKQYNIGHPKAAATYDAGYLRSSLPNIPAANPNIDRTNPQSIMDDAIARVKQIVNQPVRQIARTPGMDVLDFNNGWFHPRCHNSRTSTMWMFLRDPGIHI